MNYLKSQLTKIEYRPNFKYPTNHTITKSEVYFHESNIFSVFRMTYIYLLIWIQSIKIFYICEFFPQNLWKHFFLLHMLRKNTDKENLLFPLNYSETFYL